MPALKKINKELKETISSQIEIEGFDYAMTEKIGPEEWNDGVVPDDLKSAWLKYFGARDLLKQILREYGIDPQ